MNIYLDSQLQYKYQRDKTLNHGIYKRDENKPFKQYDSYNN